MYRVNLVLVAALVLAIISPCLCATQLVIASYGLPADLACAEATDSVKVKWIFNGTDITTRNEFAKDFTVFEANKTLRLLKVGPTTVGLPYVCRYENGTDITTFDIKVRPYVKAFDKPKNVINGDPLSLECIAWGIPSPVITWYNNNSVRLVPDGTDKIILKNNSATTMMPLRFPVLDNATVRMAMVTYADGGNYRCIASSVIGGEKYETNVTVAVQIKDKYAALWPFLGICVEVTILCVIILIYERRRAKQIAEEERQEEAERLNAPSDTKAPISDEVRQRK